MYSRYPILTCIHYASFGISVCGFRRRIYSFTRVNLKLHNPYEVLARFWKTQNSPRLLPWTCSALRLKYAEPSRFFFTIDCEGATKLRNTNFELNKIIFNQNETHEGAKTFFHTNFYLILQNVITKSQ